LGAAHNLGIVHRDVKPGNLLITPDTRVKVTDFGIARAINSANITEVGQVVGTARYMSPEQACGKEATPASDVYSLAVIGYEMLSGRTPFEGDNPVAMALAHVQTAPPALPESVPNGLRSLISQSLAKLPEQRPIDGKAFAFALHRIAIDPMPATVKSTSSIDRSPSHRPNPTSDTLATAAVQHPTTHIDQVADTDADVTKIAATVPSLEGTPLLAEGWVKARRRRRRLAGWGAALAVAACVLVLIAFGRRDGDPSIATASASDSTVPAVAAAAVATDVVTVDPAAYLGRTEAEALATLAAAGLTAVTTTGPSTIDLAGVVIEVKPSGSIAAGSNVTITLGDGTITAPTAPAAEPAGETNGNGNGNGNGKGKGKGKNQD